MCMQFISFNYSSSERREVKPVKFIAGHRKKKYIYIYTVSQKKTRHQTLAHNFPKC